MFMSPDEFYDLRMCDYPLVQQANITKMRYAEQLHRRAAYVIGAASGGKNYSRWFEQAWPFGDDKVKGDISDIIKRKDELGKKAAINLTNKVKLQQHLQKRYGNRRTKNNGRS